MPESLDEESFETATPVETPKPAPAAKKRAQGANGAAPMAGDENSPEYALVSAVLGDSEGPSRSSLKEVPPDAFQIPETRALWSAMLESDPDDLIRVSELSHVPVARLLQIADIDRMGATFNSSLRHVRERKVASEVKRLGGLLSENPAGLPDILRRLVQLADQPGTKVLPAKPINDFAIAPKSDRSCLLGNRYLNRGDGLVLVGNSGMGKSSMTLQMAILWALGRNAFGIRPNGLLKSLIIQSEDSEGDIAEVWASIVHVLKLSPKELELVRESVIVVTDRIHRGAAFIAEVREHIRAHRPDLVWINPLAAFMDGDISDAERAGVFLREQLNGLNAACEFAWCAVHHTTKPAAQQKGQAEVKWNEAQYGMAGSYEVIGWARAIMVLKAGEEPGQFDLILAKRGTRADVMVEVQGDNGITRLERTTRIPLQHATGTFRPKPLTEDIPLVFWEPRKVAASEMGQRSGRPKRHSFETYIPIFPDSQAKAQGIRFLHRCANEIMPLSISTFTSILESAVLDKLLTKDNSNPKQPKYYLSAAPK